MKSDDTALSAATGISSGAAFTIPSVFLTVSIVQPNPFNRLKIPKLEPNEMVEGQDCYVISGESEISSKETFWISQAHYLIVKYQRSLKSPKGGVAIPELTDDQLREALDSMGQTVTEENLQRLRKMMTQSQEILKTAQLAGSSTELHLDISSPEFDAKAFQFAIPKGVILKESVLGEALRAE